MNSKLIFKVDADSFSGDLCLLIFTSPGLLARFDGDEMLTYILCS